MLCNSTQLDTVRVPRHYAPSAAATGRWALVRASHTPGVSSVRLSGWPKEGAAVAQRREALPPEAFEHVRREKNHELLGAGATPLVLEEFIGARLYTGPL